MCGWTKAWAPFYFSFRAFLDLDAKPTIFPPFTTYNLHLKHKPPSYSYMGRDLYPI
jgi:hypothetical protein